MRDINLSRARWGKNLPQYFFGWLGAGEAEADPCFFLLRATFVWPGRGTVELAILCMSLITIYRSMNPLQPPVLIIIYFSSFFVASSLIYIYIYQYPFPPHRPPAMPTASPAPPVPDADADADADAVDPPPTPFLTALLAGGMAGTCVDVALFPIDTVKTRLQAPGGFLASGGFRGMYRGIGAAAAGSAPGAALFFSVYEEAKVCCQIQRQKSKLETDTSLVWR